MASFLRAKLRDRILFSLSLSLFAPSRAQQLFARQRRSVSRAFGLCARELFCFLGERKSYASGSRTPPFENVAVVKKKKKKMRADAAAFLSPRGSQPRDMSFRECEVASGPWRSSGDKPVQLVDNGDHVMMGAAAAPVWMTNGGGCGGYYHCRQCQLGVSMRALSRGTRPIWLPAASSSCVAVVERWPFANACWNALADGNSAGCVPKVQ